MRLEFSEWIFKTRINSGMKAAECAQRAGMSPTMWSRWESGESRSKTGKPAQPRRETLEAIALGLNVSLEDVTEAAGFRPNSALDYRLARKLEPILMQVSPEKRKLIETTLERTARDLVAIAG